MARAASARRSTAGSTARAAASSARTRPLLGGDPKSQGPGIGGSRILAETFLGKVKADDPAGHGTHVAGAAAAARWNKGALSDEAHCPEAGIVSYCVADDSYGTSTASTHVTAWQQVVLDQKTRRTPVVCMAYTDSADPTSTTQVALDQAVLLADVMVVTAAGNAQVADAKSPSTANGLAVGSAVPDTRKVSAFSAVGPLDKDPQRFYPDLVANGEGLTLPRPDDEAADDVGVQGTSFAAAQVAGAATLFRSLAPQATALECKAAILATTDDVQGQNLAPPHDDRNAFGLGYLRVDRLVSLARGQGLLTTGTLANKNSVARTWLPVQPGKHYAAVLAWHRTVLSSRAWSDLSLSVVLGNQVLGCADTPRNLHEKLVFEVPRPAIVTIEVRANGLDTANLPFAVAVSEVPRPFLRGSFEAIGQGCPTSRYGEVEVARVPTDAAKGFGPGSMAQPFAAGAGRLQQIVDASELGGTFAADSIAWRQDDARTSVWTSGLKVDVSLSLGPTKVAPSAMSAAFASNVTSTPTLVVKRRQLVLPSFQAPNTDHTAFDVKLPLDAPYQWPAPTGQHLLVDLVVWTSSTSVSYPVDCYYKNPVTMARVWGSSPTATSGSLLPIGTALSFGATSKTPLVPLLEGGPMPYAGGLLQLELSNGLPKGAALLWLGGDSDTWGTLPLPLDLGPFGARGCALLLPPVLVHGLGLDQDGDASPSLLLPNSDDLRGLGVRFQGLVLDPAANALGIAVSNGLRVRIGG
ncbi:MAG: S8 family serine peptidase [Planctomycetota bacterium]